MRVYVEYTHTHSAFFCCIYKHSTDVHTGIATGVGRLFTNGGGVCS